MKHIIEVISSRRAHEECLSRAIVDDANPAIIRGKAIQLIRIWAEHGACRARILTKDGQTAMEIDVPAGPSSNEVPAVGDWQASGEPHG